MNKNKIYMIICICILCISIIGSTVAYYTYELFNNNISTITHGLDYYINYEKGENINISTLVGTSSYDEGTSSDIELWKIDDTYDIYGHIYIDVNTIGTNLSKSSALRYTIVNNEKIISEGSLQGSSNGTSILAKVNIPLETTKQIYTIYIWLDKNRISNTSITGENLSLTVRCEGTMKKITGGKITDYISTLYSSANKTSVTNNNISYNYATSINLMNDKLGGVAANPDDGNIRYYGENPNNYVYFNCEDYTNPSSTTCERWRIIGVFKDVIDEKGNSEYRAKLVKADNLGYYSYDTSPSTVNSGQGTNDWSRSDLMKLFNPGYEDLAVNNSLYWNRSAGKCYTTKTDGNTDCDFSSTGITDDTKQMIKSAKYYLGTFDKEKYDIMNAGNYIEFMNLFHANQMYVYERSGDVYDCSVDDGACPRGTEWTGVIGLMYPSDYIYATDFTLCNDNGLAFGWSDWNHTNLENENCYTKDYLHTNSNEIEWLISPHYEPRFRSFTLQNGKYVFGAYVWHNYNVRPTLYLSPDVSISGGNGSFDTPYTLE